MDAETPMKRQTAHNPNKPLPFQGQRRHCQQLLQQFHDRDGHCKSWGVLLGFLLLSSSDYRVDYVRPQITREVAILQVDCPQPCQVLLDGWRTDLPNLDQPTHKTKYHPIRHREPDFYTSIVLTLNQMPLCRLVWAPGVHGQRLVTCPHKCRNNGGGQLVTAERGGRVPSFYHSTILRSFGSLWGKNTWNQSNSMNPGQ